MDQARPGSGAGLGYPHGARRVHRKRAVRVGLTGTQFMFRGRIEHHVGFEFGDALENRLAVADVYHAAAVVPIRLDDFHIREDGAQRRAQLALGADDHYRHGFRISSISSLPPEITCRTCGSSL